MLRAFGGIAGVRPAQEFAEGTLLGLAERIAKISHTVRVAGEPRRCGSASNSAPGVCCGSCFPEHPRSNCATVFAGSQANCFQRIPHSIGRRSRSVSCGPSGFWQSCWRRCRSWLGFRAALRTSTPVELPIPDTGTDHAWRGGTGRRGFSAPGPGSTGPLPGTPESSTAWRDSHARDFATCTAGTISSPACT